MEGYNKILVLLSGGIDSATCLGMAVAEVGSDNVVALTSLYGQKHSKEFECAKKLAEFYKVPLYKINLSEVLEYSDCSLLIKNDKEIIHEPYDEQTKRRNGKPVETYVPFRNGLFLSAAAAIAYSLNIDTIWYGAHADDAAGAAYPDCSVDFVNKMNSAIMEGTANMVRIDAPFMRQNKAGVVKKGLELHVPYEYTWSCYEGGDRPCGKCGTCIDRANAFKKNGVKDPAI